MISWALKRNSDNARDATAGGGDDTTQLDVPDTPAPVFAVRALKTALFGTPARRTSVKKAASPQRNDNTAALPEKSPARPPGILLTPGTGTTRRKRVSFGHDVKQGSGGAPRNSTSGLPNDAPGWAERPADTPIPKAKPKTKLQQALEDSRRSKDDESTTDTKDFALQGTEADDAWEEIDDESDLDTDVTTDLNEPHSRSGRYWKSEFETYHADAKAEMEKLVKYKQLAKSYAKMKDTEALELNQRLKEEQEKVKAMENKLEELSRQANIKARRNGGRHDAHQIDELEKQSALARDYKAQVEELEEMLRGTIDEDKPESKTGRPRRIASPRTQQMLLETNLELRRARRQLKELESLREERDRLRSDLKFAEQRANKLGDENRKLSGELSKSTLKAQELEKNLGGIKETYEKLKTDAKTSRAQAEEVLKHKNERIKELQEELATLKAETRRANRASRTTSLDEPRTSTNNERSTALKSSLETAEENKRLLRELDELKRATNGLLSSDKPKTAGERRTTEGYRQTSLYRDDPTLTTSRALRQKIDRDLGKVDTAAVLNDRANLQDSTSSSGRSAHSSQEDDLSRTPSRTSSRPRSSWTSFPSRNSKDAVEDEREKRAASRASLVQAKKLPPRPLSVADADTTEIDLVQGNFARLGGPQIGAGRNGGDGGGGGVADSSAVWSNMNTSRLSMPADRAAAAVWRVNQKRIARGLPPLDRNKENVRLR
ncbi:spindle pole body formation-associated protein-domain-containing protein [Podospora australis]|uniref:Spindle pole body formation-associated protein-domain-containing protein n=1 Tax=Podospora australis TaxID=1536484 RepID=A0AAN7AKQ1_9PEZI|nr:spindle pole body formation-associated protein-domain-containing protein [Podospora australis]